MESREQSHTVAIFSYNNIGRSYGFSNSLKRIATENNVKSRLITKLNERYFLTAKYASKFTSLASL